MFYEYPSATLRVMSPRKLPLTPTVITDKNGKVTTVHKRDKEQSSDSKFPAPALSDSVETASPSLVRVMAMVSKRERESDQPPLRDRKSLAKLHGLMLRAKRRDSDLNDDLTIQQQGTLARLDNHQTEVLISAYGKEGFPLACSLMYGTVSLGQLCGFAALYEPDLLMSGDWGGTDIEKARNHLDRYVGVYALLRKQLGLNHDSYSDMSKEDEESLKRIRRFMLLYGALCDLGQKGKMDQGLVDYMLDGRNDARSAVTVIRETGSTDLSSIRGIVEGASKPVAEGWL